MNKIWTGWVTPDWRAMSWPDRLAWLIGSGFGSGFSPLAPGTAGSALATVIYCAVMLSLPRELGFIFRASLLLAMAAVGFVVGVWATGRMSTDDNPDPGTAVWDEFVGMWLTALPTTTLPWHEWTLPTTTLPWHEWTHPPTFWIAGWVAAAFIVFRAFDTLKPWPCRRLERLHGGWGIMLDDAAAAVWGLLTMQVLFTAAALMTFLFQMTGVIG